MKLLDGSGIGAVEGEVPVSRLGLGESDADS